MENKGNKTKIIKIVFFILLLIVMAVGIFTGVFLYLKSKKTESIPASSALYYAIFEDGTYYIPKAEQNVKFEISEENADSYKLTNSGGENIETSIIEYNRKKIHPAKTKI